MITSEMMTELAQGKRPSFLFVSDGVVQFRQQEPYGIGPIVATTSGAAKVVKEDLEKQTGQPIAIAEVGTLRGETLANHIDLAVIKHGATGLFVTEDGTIYAFVKAPPPE